MRVEKDFKELLELLNRHKVRYLIIGAFAVAFYSKPRYTKDIDILVEPEERNAGKIIAALSEFGFNSLDLKENDFVITGNIVQLGYEPVRVDLVTGVKGFRFLELWRSRKRGEYGTIKVNFVGLDDLIRMKKKARRENDLTDLKLLLRMKQK